MTTHAQGNWPPAVEVLNEDGGSDIVLVCEHASNHIPAEYERLGLGGQHLTRQIAWDIGAAGVTRLLSARLGAAAFLSGYSRLLIDVNKPPGTESSIPRRSESTDIPGNRDISQAEKAHRTERMFAPFHERITDHLDRRVLSGKATRLITVHSFTPVSLGRQQPWHVGVIYCAAREFGEAMLSHLCSDSALKAVANQPDVIARDDDYAIPIHGDDRGIPAVMVKIRQDLISTDRGIAEWADRLAGAIPPRS